LKRFKHEIKRESLFDFSKVDALVHERLRRLDGHCLNYDEEEDGGDEKRDECHRNQE